MVQNLKICNTDTHLVFNKIKCFLYASKSIISLRQTHEIFNCLQIVCSDTTGLTSLCFQSSYKRTHQSMENTGKNKKKKLHCIFHYLFLCELCSQRRTSFGILMLFLPNQSCSLSLAQPLYLACKATIISSHFLNTEKCNFTIKNVRKLNYLVLYWTLDLILVITTNSTVNILFHVPRHT